MNYYISNNSELRNGFFPIPVTLPWQLALSVKKAHLSELPWLLAVSVRKANGYLLSVLGRQTFLNYNTSITYQPMLNVLVEL